MGCGQQSGTVPVRIPISYWSLVTPSPGAVGSQLGPLSSSSNWNDGATVFWENSQNQQSL
jgi:hypothetical protein